MATKTLSIRGWGGAEFSQEALDTMRAVTEKSEIERRVYSFLLCRCLGRINPSGEIVPGVDEELLGERLLATSCPRGCKPEGLFVSHPSAHPERIPTLTEIRVGVQTLLPIVCAGTNRKIVCYRIPERILDYRRVEKMYSKEARDAFKHLIQRGFGPDEIIKYPGYADLIEKANHNAKLCWSSTSDFARAIERQDRLTLRRYGKYGGPFLEVVW